MPSCGCETPHVRRRVVLTGGPGAGKTATLEVIRKTFCDHVLILPEAAGVIFGGGFPRGGAQVVRQAAQRAIFYTQRELEATAEATEAAVVLCDRGTVDGEAYWPGPGSLWPAVGTTLAAQVARYEAVIHMRTPPIEHGYDLSNPLRTETPEEAAAIDARLLRAWEGHPRRIIVEATPAFLTKVLTVLLALWEELPPCCRGEVVPSLSGLPTGRPWPARRP